MTDTRLMFGDWSIPYDEIDDVVIATVPIQIGAGTHGRLIVRAGGQVYQFILPLQSNWDWEGKVHPYWGGSLPFSVRRIEMEFERTYLNWLGGLAVGMWIIILLLKYWNW